MFKLFQCNINLKKYLPTKINIKIIKMMTSIWVITELFLLLEISISNLDLWSEQIKEHHFLCLHLTIQCMNNHIHPFYPVKRPQVAQNGNVRLGQSNILHIKGDTSGPSQPELIFVSIEMWLAQPPSQSLNRYFLLTVKRKRSGINSNKQTC